MAALPPRSRCKTLKRIWKNERDREVSDPIYFGSAGSYSGALPNLCAIPDRKRLDSAWPVSRNQFGGLYISESCVLYVPVPVSGISRFRPLRYLSACLHR